MMGLLDKIANFLGKGKFIEWQNKSKNWTDSNIQLPKIILSAGNVNVSVNVKVYKMDETLAPHSEKLLKQDAILVAADTVIPEINLFLEDVDAKELLKEFQTYSEPQHFNALRLSILAQKLHEDGKNDQSIRVVKNLRDRYGEAGNAIHNLYISSHLKEYILFTLNWYKFETNFDVQLTRNRFLPEFKEALKDYKHAIFIGTTKRVDEIVSGIKQKFADGAIHISLYSRELKNNEKLKLALEIYQADEENPKINIEPFENTYFRVQNALNYRIYNTEYKGREKKYSRKERKRLKRLRKRK